ncbi:MAG: glycine cleavage system aminomethyltransferase GcvT [Myxococcales bacterium]|nr:glycine cleavage system aminomethyltransferase GcvT [Myxococcales bacterium]MCB9626699.1 glycine cleavage system aminomethyltransferase GcvT [Sandaracinaceae bacterium]
MSRTVTAPTTPLLETPLVDEHRALGARLVPFAGWLMPVQYEGIRQEHEAVRNGAGLFDVSHMGELHLEGPDAVAVVDSLVTNAVKDLPVGKALYTCCCNAEGKILDDLIIYRRGEDRILVVCNAGNREKISAHFAKHAKGRCSFRDASDETALLALQGPKAEQALREVGCDAHLPELGAFHLADGKVAGVDCIVARTGYTAEDGFELFCANADAPKLFRALLAAPVGVKPIGLGARDTLRLEGKLSLYGNDIDETTNPLEAGLGWVVKLDGDDFLGRDALRAIKAAGVTRKLVGIEMTGRGIARHGYPVVVDGQTVGVVTSGSPSITLGTNIGLAYVPVDKAAVGTVLGIEIRGKIIDAVVVKTPFYKRQPR